MVGLRFISKHNVITSVISLILLRSTGRANLRGQMTLPDSYVTCKVGLSSIARAHSSANAGGKGLILSSGKLSTLKSFMQQHIAQTSQK